MSFDISAVNRSGNTFHSTMSLPTRTLGKNGPQVQALGVGLMSLSHAYGFGGSDEERFAFLDKAFDLGERFWDSADLYGDNEDLLGKWFKRTGKRDQVFLATKFGFTADHSIRSDPDYVRTACDKSLERLGIDHIDLYYCHRVDGKTPVEKTVEAMAGLKKEGKIHYLGLSEVSAQTLRRAHAVHPISALQTEFSPFTMEIEDHKIGLLDTCRELGTSVIAYSPLGRGVLAGSIKSLDDFPADDWRRSIPRFFPEHFHKNTKLVEQFHTFAKKKNCTVGQLTLAWLSNQGQDIIPIPGTRSVKNLEDNIGSLKVSFTPEEDKEIRKAVEEAEVHGDRYPEA